jgi:hypothetical protein
VAAAYRGTAAADATDPALPSAGDVVR